MGHSVTLQILDYPGIQKFAQWGMTELLDYANKKAENLGSLLFTSEIALQPIRQPVIIVPPPSVWANS